MRSIAETCCKPCIDSVFNELAASIHLEFNPRFKAIPKEQVESFPDHQALGSPELEHSHLRTASTLRI